MVITHLGHIGLNTDCSGTVPKCFDRLHSLIGATLAVGIVDDNTASSTSKLEGDSSTNATA